MSQLPQDLNISLPFRSRIIQCNWLSEIFSGLHSLNIVVWDPRFPGCKYTGSSELAWELFWKYFWVREQENVGSSCFALGETFQYPKTASGSLQSVGGKPPPPPPVRVSRYVDTHVLPSQGQCGWAGGRSSHLAAHPGGKNPVVSQSRPRLGCCSRLLLFVLSEDLLGNK